MRVPKLTYQEKEIEKALLEGKYTPVSDNEFMAIAEALNRRKKNAVLNVRINRKDLEDIKKKAKRLGIRYQTFIAEVLHKVAM